MEIRDWVTTWRVGPISSSEIRSGVSESEGAAFFLFFLRVRVYNFRARSERRIFRAHTQQLLLIRLSVLTLPHPVSGNTEIALAFMGGIDVLFATKISLGSRVVGIFGGWGGVRFCYRISRNLDQTHGTTAGPHLCLFFPGV